MRNRSHNPVSLWTIVFLLPSATALAQSATIAYQGRLDYDGSSVNLPHDFRFYFFSDPTHAVGAEVWSQQIDNVPVAAGEFAVALGPLPDAVLSLDTIYLSVSVKLSSLTSWTQLNGRQQIFPVARALTATPGVTFVAYDPCPSETSCYSVSVAGLAQFLRPADFASDVSIAGELVTSGRVAAESTLGVGINGASHHLEVDASGNLQTDGVVNTAAGLRLDMTIATCSYTNACACPAGYHATGGGVDCQTHPADYHAILHASAPFDDDADGAAEGWFGQCLMENIGYMELPEVVYAVCARIAPR